MDFETTSHLAVLDFKHEIKRLTEEFTGREWIFDKIDNWLKCKNERFFILTGEPGVGKSAIAARLTQVRTEEIAAYHFCLAGNVSTITSNTALRSLAAQLGESLPGYGKALANTIKPHQVRIDVKQHIEKVEAGAKVVGVIIEHINASNPDEDLEILFRAPLAALEPPAEPVIILIDSLDEAATYAGQTNLITLLAKANDLPSWVRFVCTTRPAETILSHFKRFEPYTLAAESQMNLDDLNRYIDYRIAKDVMHAQLKTAGVKPRTLDMEVKEIADGNFLYTKVLLNDIQAGQQPLDDLYALPKSLNEIYHRFLRRFSDDDWDQPYQPILGKLAVAQEWLTEDLLAAFSGLRPRQVRRSLGVLAQYLDAAKNEKGDAIYRLFHQSLRDYLLGRRRSGLFWCDPEEEHELIADHYTKQYQAKWQDCDGYGLRHLPFHLTTADQVQQLRALLTDFNWLQAKLEATDINALIRDYDILDLEAAEGQPFEIIRSALRLSAHVLGQNKTQLAGQLLGRLLDFKEDEIQYLLEGAKDYQGAPWLRPLTASLDSPGGPLVRTIQEPTKPITGVAVTPNGQHIISGYMDDTLIMWELASGREVRTFQGHRRVKVIGLVTERGDITVMPDGQKVISGSGDTLKIWDLASGRIVNKLKGHTHMISAVAVTPDGHYIVSGSWDKTLKVWDVASGHEVHTLKGHTDRITAVVVTPDGQHIISGSRDHNLKVWNISAALNAGIVRENGLCSEDVCTLKGHTDWITNVTVTPDGQHTISGSLDGTLKVWEVTTGREVRTLKVCDMRLLNEKGIGRLFTSLPVTTDGRYIISGSSDDILKVWEFNTGREVNTLKGHTNRITAVTLTPDGQHIISRSRDHTLKVWNISTALNASLFIGGSERSKEVLTLQEQTSYITAMVVTPDGQHLVISSYDLYPLKLLEVSSRRKVRKFQVHTRPITTLAVTSDGKNVISGCVDKTLKIWELESGRVVNTLKGHTDEITAVVVTPDGQHIISGSRDHTLKVWNISAALNAGIVRENELCSEKVRTLKGHTDEITAVEVTPDGKLVISGSYDKSLKVWDVATGREQRTLQGHKSGVTAVEVTPDGSHVISGSRVGTLKIWDVANIRKVHTLHGHTDRVNAVVVTPDGSHVISGSSDNTLKVWNVATGKCIANFQAEGSISDCAISPDGHTFIAGDAAGGVHFLRLERL
ncbi:AAA family ATPase [Chloroflexota bacterium]